MIDVYAPAGTFERKREPAQDLAAAVMRWEGVPEIGASDSVRVQVLTPAGMLDRDKQLGVVRELTEIVATAALGRSAT
jgi:hypothetical protein